MRIDRRVQAGTLPSLFGPYWETMERARPSSDSGDVSGSMDADASTAVVAPASRSEPATGSPSRAASTADRMGRYVVLEEVGRGGMGQVLRAYDPKLERGVAVKGVGLELVG